MGLRIALFLTSLAALALPAAAASDEIQITDTVRVGGHIVVTQPLEGPLHAAGGNIRIEAPVHGNVRVAGGTVVVAPEAVISESVSIAAGTIKVDGTVNGELSAMGGNVSLNGPVAGDVSVRAGTLNLGPDARIAGKLSFRGGQLNQDPAAQVTGGITQKTGRHWGSRERTPAERFLRGWLWTAGLIVLAALIAAALPGPSQRMARELRARPWITPLLGLIALTVIPVAAVLAMITVIGIPLGLLALFGYAALLLVGYAWLAVVVGGLLLDRINPEAAAQSAWRVGAAMLAMLTLAILARLPFVGGLVMMVALVVGVGMIVAAVMRRDEATPAAAA